MFDVITIWVFLFGFIAFNFLRWELSLNTCGKSVDKKI